MFKHYHLKGKQTVGKVLTVFYVAQFPIFSILRGKVLLVISTLISLLLANDRILEKQHSHNKRF